jgi:hypothetical protein
MTTDFKQNIALQLNYRMFRDQRFRMSYAFVKLAIIILLKPHSIYRLPIDRYCYIDISGSTVLDVITVLKYATWHLITGITVVSNSKIIHPHQWVETRDKVQKQYNRLIQLNNGN